MSLFLVLHWQPLRNHTLLQDTTGKLIELLMYLLPSTCAQQYILPYLGQPHPPVHPTCSAAPMFGSSAGASCTTGPPNPNPFYLKFITGNIHICQGCRQSLRTSSGSILDPPYNLVVARSEKRPYRDSSGELVIPSSYSNAYYHVAVSCISHAEPMFHPSMLKIASYPGLPMFFNVHDGRPG